MSRLISFPVDRVRKLVLLKTALKVQGLINYVSTFQGRNYDILGHAAVELGR